MHASFKAPEFYNYDADGAAVGDLVVDREDISAIGGPVYLVDEGESSLTEMSWDEIVERKEDLFDFEDEEWAVEGNINILMKNGEWLRVEALFDRDTLFVEDSNIIQAAFDKLLEGYSIV